MSSEPIGQSSPKRPNTNHTSEANGGGSGKTLSSADESKYEKERIHRRVASTPLTSILAFVVLLIISYATIPTPFQPVGKPTLLHVWYYGWITAISTGLGVLPLVFFPEMSDYYVGCANAVAAGMMIAASYSLFVEGCTFIEADALGGDTISSLSPEVRTAIGAVVGLGFIFSTKQFLDDYEDLKVGGIGGADARRAILIFFVMLLHSFSEGVGIGVSFGGEHGSELGMFISASLAVHNIPEGLAIAVVLLPQKKIDYLTASLWAVLTSIPQPVMAVPAYLFVKWFIRILPVGLGFAGGAMAWVALFELLVEALEDTKSMVTTGILTVCSLCTMLWLQSAIDEEARSS